MAPTLARTSSRINTESSWCLKEHLALHHLQLWIREIQDCWQASNTSGTLMSQSHPCSQLACRNSCQCVYWKTRAFTELCQHHLHFYNHELPYKSATLWPLSERWLLFLFFHHPSWNRGIWRSIPSFSTLLTFTQRSSNHHIS